MSMFETLDKFFDDDAIKTIKEVKEFLYNEKIEFNEVTFMLKNEKDPVPQFISEFKNNIFIGNYNYYISVEDSKENIKHKIYMDHWNNSKFDMLWNNYLDRGYNWLYFYDQPKKLEKWVNQTEDINVIVLKIKHK